MARLTYVIPFILLILTPSPTVGYAAFFGICEELFMSWMSNPGYTNNNDFSATGIDATMLNELSDKIGSLENRIDDNYNEIVEKIEELGTRFIHTSNREKLSEIYAIVQDKYDDLTLSWIELRNQTITINDLPSSDLESPSSDFLVSVHRLMKLPEFFTQLSTDWQNPYKESSFNPCKNKLSNLQIRYAAFLQYMVFLKNYFVSGFIALILQQLKENANYAHRRNRFVKKLENSVNSDWEYFKDILAETSREFYTCDPEDNDEPWYYELEAFTLYYAAQIYLPNECQNKPCSNVKRLPCTQNYEFDHGFCEYTRPCKNKLVSCSVSDLAHVCALEGKGFESRYRRYAFISANIEEGPKRCEKPRTQVDIGYWTRNSRYTHIYHKCVCSEYQYYISTFPVVASPDYVIVGAQLAMHEHTLYISLTEGQLLPNGKVTNVRPAPDFKNEPEWKDYRVVIDKDTKFDLSPSLVYDNENRALTGVQFIESGKNNITLAIHSKAIHIKNKNSGKLVANTAQIIKKTSFPEEEFDLTNVDRSNNTMGKNSPVSAETQYVRFQVTGTYEDGGQTTVPFIDLQKVQTKHAEPLSGISLYIRGQQGYGGFLALKLYTFDVSAFVPKSENFRDIAKILTDAIPKIKTTG